MNIIAEGCAVPQQILKEWGTDLSLNLHFYIEIWLQLQAIIIHYIAWNCSTKFWSIENSFTYFDGEQALTVHSCITCVSS